MILTDFVENNCAEGAYFDPVKVEVQPKVLFKPIGLSYRDLASIFWTPFLAICGRCVTFNCLRSGPGHLQIGSDNVCLSVIHPSIHQHIVTFLRSVHGTLPNPPRSRLDQGTRPLEPSLSPGSSCTCLAHSQVVCACK